MVDIVLILAIPTADFGDRGDARAKLFQQAGALPDGLDVSSRKGAVDIRQVHGFSGWLENIFPLFFDWFSSFACLLLALSNESVFLLELNQPRPIATLFVDSLVQLLARRQVIAFRRQPVQALVVLANALEKVNGEQGPLGVDGSEGVAVAGLYRLSSQIDRSMISRLCNFHPFLVRTPNRQKRRGNL